MMPAGPGCKSIASLLLLASLGGGPEAARAEFQTGSSLLKLCDAEPGSDAYAGGQLVCMSYISGIADSFDCRTPLGGWRWQSPNGLALGEMQASVVGWLKSNRHRLGFGASGLVASALSQIYPCPRR